MQMNRVVKSPRLILVFSTEEVKKKIREEMEEKDTAGGPRVNSFGGRFGACP
jgi:hypothetical protein